jgi:TonB family protein
LKTLTTGRQRLFSLAIVASFHFVLLLAFLSWTPFSAERQGLELMVSIVSARPETRPEPVLAFQKPAADFVPAPEIDIADPQPNVVTQVSMVDPSRILPPRPDPAHTNALPGLPAVFHQLGPTVSALIKVLVLSDGSIADARISRSTGDTKLDAVALVYVKQHWRFLPALASGAAVQCWTTTLVMFRSV